MRWLTGAIGRRARLVVGVKRDETGAVAIVLAVIMVALIGATALTLDVGALYAERQQLQNGADAAALAIAEDCAKGACSPLSNTATANTFANSNANDGAAGVNSITFPTPGVVQVTTKTRASSGNGGLLALSFAPVLGIPNRAVAATAKAAWGGPASGPAVLPLAFAPCNFQLNGPIQVLSMHGDSGGTPCSSVSPSGQLLPGGFGWLADPGRTCSAQVDVANNAPISGRTGISWPSECDSALNFIANKTVLLPIYSDLGGNGNGSWYVIKGWAAFTLLGWNFPGNRYNNNTYAGAKCSGTCKGIIGKFVGFVTLDDRFTRGGPNLGAAVVTLTQ